MEAGGCSEAVVGVLVDVGCVIVDVGASGGHCLGLPVDVEVLVADELGALSALPAEVDRAECFLGGAKLAERC